MKIHLIVAPSSSRVSLSEFSEDIAPPLGIGYIAASLRQAFPEASFKISDGLISGLETVHREAEAFAADIVFISFFTPQAQGAYELVNLLKTRGEAPLIVLGGVHASSLPEEALERSLADIVVIGEGERAAVEIAKCFSDKSGFSDIDGIIYRKGREIIRTRPPRFIQDINSIPFPARDLLPMDKYKGWFVSKKTPETSMVWSRGCPYNCVFCSNLVWKCATPAVRLRSPQNIVAEMKHLRDEFGIQEVFDHSDEFNNNIEHAKEVCRQIKESKLKMPWKAQLRAHPLPEDLVRLMAEAGCWYVHLGVESGNEETLKGVGKHINLNQVVDACRLLHKYGIKIFGLFMLFNVWEDEKKLCFEDVAMTRKTLKFAEYLVDKKLLDYISWTIATPYPGSQLFEIARRHKLIRKDLLANWERWLKDDSFIMDLPGISKAEQSRLYSSGSWLRAKCYLRSGGFGMSHAGFFLRKAVKAFQIGFSGARGILR